MCVCVCVCVCVGPLHGVRLSTLHPTHGAGASEEEQEREEAGTSMLERYKRSLGAGASEKSMSLKYEPASEPLHISEQECEEAVTARVGCMLERYNRRLEELVLGCPAQYLWAHDRWRSNRDKIRASI